MKTSKEQRASLRLLEAKATRGPWLRHDAPVKWDTPLLCGYDRRETHATPPYWATGPNVPTVEQAADDSLLIVVARNSLVPLLDDLDEQAQELELLRVVEEAARQHDCSGAPLCDQHQNVGAHCCDIGCALRALDAWRSK